MRTQYEVLYFTNWGELQLWWSPKIPRNRAKAVPIVPPDCHRVHTIEEVEYQKKRAGTTQKL